MEQDYFCYLKDLLHEGVRNYLDSQEEIKEPEHVKDSEYTSREQADSRGYHPTKQKSNERHLDAYLWQNSSRFVYSTILPRG